MHDKDKKVVFGATRAELTSSVVALVFIIGAIVLFAIILKSVVR